MRLLLDECSGAHALYELLTIAGHDVERSIDSVGAAAADEQVLQYAIEGERAVVTMNCADFVALVHDRAHPGLLLHYRGAKGGLTHAEIVDAIGTVERALPSVRGVIVPLNQYVWKLK